jgi:hypothetical protein
MVMRVLNRAAASLALSERSETAVMSSIAGSARSAITLMTSTRLIAGC